MNQESNQEPAQIANLLSEAYQSRVHNLKASIALAEKALMLSGQINNLELTGKSLNHLSLFFMILGDYEEATIRAKKAIKIFEELEDEQGIANAKYNIAGVYYKSDNYHLGLTYLIDCLKTYKKHNDYHNISRTEKSLGTIYEYFGDQKKALKSYLSAIEAGKMTGDPNLESNAYNNLSGVYLKNNKVDEAMEMIERSIAMKKQTGDIRGYAFAVYGRGKVNTRKGCFAEAEADFKEAMLIHEEMGEKLGRGMAFHKLAVLYLEMGERDKARATANEGLAFSEQYNIVIIKFKCDFLLYRIYKLENNTARALEYLERYLKQKEAVINTQTLKVIENYELISQMETLAKEAQLQREKAEIIEKKNRAEETARVRQEFLSTMSHEIRTPLNAVISIISLLTDKTEEDEKMLLDSLKFASNNLLRIINDILDFTKLESGKTKLEPHKTLFKPLMENIWRTYESQAKEKGLKLVLKIDINIAESYELDETKIVQILGNLISNAIKFTDTGKVEIEIELVESAGDTDRILFKISDTGQGIPENFRDIIFESFSQTSPVTTRKQGGTGLGLAIVKKLVNLHGSEIALNSEPGKGSEFYFEIELKKSLAPVRDKVDYTTQLNGKVALIAEDNDINAFVIQRLLSKWGIQTELALNGIEAIAKSNGRKFDFILMDIHMPEMNGYEATIVIRNKENPNTTTPIFALTADIMASHEENYSNYFNGFLWKPLQVEKLFEALTGIEQTS